MISTFETERSFGRRGFDSSCNLKKWTSGRSFDSFVGSITLIMAFLFSSRISHWRVWDLPFSSYYSMGYLARPMASSMATVLSNRIESSCISYFDFDFLTSVFDFASSVVSLDSSRFLDSSGFMDPPGPLDSSVVPLCSSILL